MNPTDGRVVKVKWLSVAAFGTNAIMRSAWVRTRRVVKFGVDCEEYLPLTRPTGGKIRCVALMPWMYHRSAN